MVLVRLKLGNENASIYTNLLNRFKFVSNGLDRFKLVSTGLDRFKLVWLSLIKTTKKVRHTDFAIIYIIVVIYLN